MTCSVCYAPHDWVLARVYGTDELTDPGYPAHEVGEPLGWACTGHLAEAVDTAMTEQGDVIAVRRA